MLQISVNGLTRNAASRPENWGELLDLLEEGEGPERQIVTAVRFGGVAVPTFREPVALSRPLRAVGPIDVEAAPLDQLLRMSAQAAFESLAPLKRASARIASRLRQGDTMTALRDLPALTGAIQRLTLVTSVLGGARFCVEPHRADFDALVLRLCRLVESVTTRQASVDWTGVADVLARELLLTLDAWGLVARRVWTTL